VPYNQQSDLEDAMSIATVRTLFEDEANGEVNSGSVTAVLRRANAQINSFIARNYPSLVLPDGAEGATVPETLKAAELEFAIVYSYDRKIEYWSGRQENERRERIKAAFEMAERYARAEQVAFDSPAAKPSNVGGIVYSSGPRTVADSIDGTSNNGDF
jgi:hypothetical protein